MIDDFLPSGGNARFSQRTVKPRDQFSLPEQQAEPAAEAILDEPVVDDTDRPQSVETPIPEETALPDTASESASLAAVEDEALASAAMTDEANDLDNEAPEPDKPKKKFRWPLSRKQTIIGGVIVVLLIGGGVVAALSSKPSTKSGVYLSKRPPKPKPKITTVASTLSGLQVDPSVNTRPVTAVMIENSTDARPQSGLDQASVVFEALAEGGVTRFMALFQDTQPDYIGPVRSARPYYVSWADGFNAGYAHVGGSPDGLADIKSWGVRDLDQFYNSAAYHRITSRDAPHNVYTSIAALNQLEQTKGYTSSSFSGFARKKEAPSKTPNATSIDMTFSGPTYNSHFDYDAASNSYKRSEAGAPHMEISSAGVQTQITPKVVIGMVVPESQGALDASNAYYSNYNTIGSGQAFVFQDGVVTTGTWSKASNDGALTFSDATGKPLALNPGQTWISAVTSASNVTYK